MFSYFFSSLGENKSIFTKLKDYPYEFEINDSLQLASINGVKVGTVTSNDSSLNSYSTEEISIGKWIGGETIYRKVIPVTIPSTVNHGISDMDVLVKFSLTWYDTIDKCWYDRMRLWEGSYGVGLEANVTPTQVNVSTSRYNSIDWTTRTSKAYAILEYTKKP